MADPSSAEGASDASSVSSEPPRVPPLLLLRQDGLLDPVLVGGDLGVDAGDVPAAAADAEAHDSHLVPLAVLLADEGTAAVALKQERIDSKYLVGYACSTCCITLLSPPPQVSR